MSAVVEQYPPQLRPMILQDLPAVLAIENSAYEFPWSIGIFSDCLRVGYPCWIYEVDDEIQGYTVMSIAADEGHILNLCVNPELQGQGIGKILLEGVFDTARRFDIKQIFLEVRPSNKVALGLYHSFGFNEVGTRRKYYPAKKGREDAIILAKSL